MSERLIAVPTMHEDHRNWQSILSMWQQDLKSWDKQLEKGLSQFEELQRMLACLHKILVDHRNAIEQREESLRMHEHDLASCERLGMGYLEALTLKHLDMKRQVDGTSLDHEQIKKHHHNLMAKLAELVTTMNTSV